MMDVIPFSEDGESQTALTISQSQGSLRNQLSKEKLEWLREQRESHKHKTIWTKDAHGGPYKKVWGVLVLTLSTRFSLGHVRLYQSQRYHMTHPNLYFQANDKSGIDPLKENLDGSTKSVALGHEVAEVGPTSNFVGNHMTQGAIDMVQALLKMRTKEETMNVRPPLRIGEGDVVEDTQICSHPGILRASSVERNAQKPLVILESSKVSDNETMVLLERPYSEDITCSMSLSTVFDTHSVDVQFCIFSKNGNILKKFQRKIELAPSEVSIQSCECYLSSGTVEEMKTSENVANKTVPIQHSDPSTVICIFISTKESHQGIQHILESRASLSSIEAQSHLAALKSMIRKSRP